MDLQIAPDSKPFQETKTFRHAGDLNNRFDKFDPRNPEFGSPNVDIDLRNCDFVLPAAALWCAVYLSLAQKRGSPCELLIPPGNLGVCMYLKSLGLFENLTERGVKVDDRGIFVRPNPKTILPITHFTTAAGATEVTNLAYDKLRSSNLGAANLTTVVTELFGELTMNAAQHSESEVGAFACVQFSEKNPRFTCCVADGGIGVLKHLKKNPKLRVNYDWDALELAVRERVSGTGDPNRGIGLYGVSEDVRHPNHSLLLHSGFGSLEINEDVEISARRTKLFPGTLAFLSIPA